MHRLLYMLLLTLCAGGWMATATGCQNPKFSYKESQNFSDSLDRDPLPTELSYAELSPDSLRAMNRDKVKREMAAIINNYRGRFTEEHFTGYFVTDLNNDGMPELWVKIGNFRENARLELYVAGDDGKLVRSSELAEPGKYYLGDGFVRQVVTRGAGYINVNKITINSNGEMDIETEREIDLYAEPGARMPTYKERQLPDISFRNLTPLYDAFH